MSSIFQSFTEGFAGGQAQARERRRQIAQQMAGQRFAAGDAAGARTDLVNAGMYAEAGAMGELGEQQRAERIRSSLQGAVASLAPTAGRRERLEAQRGVLEGEGELTQANELDAQIAALDDRQRQTAGEAMDWLGSQSLGLIDAGVPVEQRKARALQILASSPYANVEGMRAMVENAQDWSDAGLQATARSALSLAERFGLQERAEDRRIEGERWQKSFDEQRRQFNVSEANQNARASRERGLGVGQQVTVAEQLRDNFDRNVKPVAEILMQTGMVETLQEKVARGERLSGTEKNGLLFMIARMMQGGGILTDQDVGWMKAQNLAETTEAGVNRVIGDGSQVSDALVGRLMRIAGDGRSRALDTARRGIDETTARARNIGIDTGYVFGGDPYDLYKIKRAQTPAGPAVGAVVNGYRFKGGDPNNQSSWEPANTGASGVPATSPGRVQVR